MRHFSSRPGWPRVRAVVLAAILTGLTVIGARAQVPIAPGIVSGGTLSFDGHASVGDFTGTTSTLRGAMTGGPDLASVKGWVEAPVRSLVTGNRRRDADLNSSMESARYPLLRYELDGVTTVGRSGDTTNVLLRGRFLIHGVTRSADLPGRVLLTGAGARVWADTPLNLKDYHIGGLSKLLGILRMHETIEVHVDVTFTSDPGDPGDTGHTSDPGDPGGTSDTGHTGDSGDTG